MRIAGVPGSGTSILIDGQTYGVRVIGDRKNVGTVSIGYSCSSTTFLPRGRDTELESIVVDALNTSGDVSLTRSLDSIVRHLRQSVHSPDRVPAELPISGFTARDWKLAVRYGLVRRANRTVISDAEPIADYYARQGIHYVQIDGWGLYSTGENPASLPVEKISGTLDLKVMVVASGAAQMRAGLRVSVALSPGEMSRYTLDDVDSIREMFALS